MIYIFSNLPAPNSFGADMRQNFRGVSFFCASIFSMRRFFRCVDFWGSRFLGGGGGVEPQKGAHRYCPLDPLLEEFMDCSSVKITVVLIYRYLDGKISVCAYVQIPKGFLVGANEYITPVTKIGLTSSRKSLVNLILFLKFRRFFEC